MPSTTNKRSYRKLSNGDEEELVRMWGTGASTIADLALHFSMSPRGVQAALSRLDAKKGRPGMATVRRLVSAAATPMPISSDHADRQRDAIESAYLNAIKLEALVMEAVAEASALGGVAALRALDIGTSALARITSMKRTASGLGALNPVTSDSLPELTIRELTTHEIAAIRNQQLEDDRAAIDITTADDDLICEGDDDGDTAIRCAA